MKKCQPVPRKFKRNRNGAKNLDIYEETVSQCPGNSKETEMVPKIWAYMKKLSASAQEIRKKQKWCQKFGHI